jgi:PAS domain S-box-containing protein
MNLIERELGSDYYKIIFETTEEGIWLIDENSLTLMANNKLASILGYTPKEMVGQSIFEFMDEEHESVATNNVQRRREGVREQHEFLLQKKDGSYVWTSMASSPIKSSDGKYIGALAFVSDITARKRTEVLLTAQKSIFELLTSQGTLSEALDILVTSIESLVRGVAGSVLLLKTDGKSVSCASAPNLPTDFSQALEGAKIGPREGSCGTAMFIKEKVIVSDIATDPLWTNYKELALKHDLRACWANPIISHSGEVLGSFAMYFKSQRLPNSDELHLVDDFTAAASLSIEHIRTREKEKKQRVYSALLADTREALGRALDFRVVLRQIPHLLTKDFSDWCFVTLPDQDGNLEMVSVAGTKDKAELIKSFDVYRPDMRSTSGIVQAIREMKPVLYAEVSEEYLNSNDPKVSTRDPFYLEQMKKLGFKSFMAAPFIVRGKAMGGISVFSSQKERRFNHSDLELLGQITESCAMAIDNSILYNESQKTIKAREEFISVASHELRTPLTSLKLRLDLLTRMVDQADLPEELRNKIVPIMSKIHPDIQRLSLLVDTLLDISRLNSKKLHLSREHCDFSYLLQEELSRLEPEFKLQGTQLISKIEPNITGLCDAVRIQQIITNLLMNSLKFGERKPVEFSAEKRDDFILLTIKDHGIGISAPDMERIFQPFERAVSDKNFGGLGLGLFITLQIIKAHGGKIDVQSSLGQGTTFIIEIPLHSK